MHKNAHGQFQLHETADYFNVFKRYTGSAKSKCAPVGQKGDHTTARMGNWRVLTQRQAASHTPPELLRLICLGRRHLKHSA